ncbi:MAG: hypothetical protein GWP91_13910 [Rhodobacterales bacterium]|nr:hypothetical protein [Rhodobacterales bacterium]
MSRVGHFKEQRLSLAFLALLVGGKLVMAQEWGLLADEALYWVWSTNLASGYFDQPPLIAWALRATTLALGASPLALRLAPIVMGLLVVVSGWRHAGDKALWGLWVVAVPSLMWLTWFATPDAFLLGFWAAGLSFGIRGGRYWLLAGLCAGLAVQSKYSGLWLMPALLLANPSDLRERWPWMGLALMGLIAAPNIGWNAAHDWVSLRFAFSEGLNHAHPPGLSGPLMQIVGQLGVASPILGLLGAAWCVSMTRQIWLGSATRIERVCWWTSAPLLVSFALAALGGPPEAHWPAPAWIGIGLGLSHRTGRWVRVAWMGTGLGVALSALLVVHSLTPVVRLSQDPAARLTEGPILGRAVAVWALPDGVAAWEDGVEHASPIWTERYQEAALIHYYTGIPARVFPGCGRPNQYDLWPVGPREPGLFLRPATGGPPTCVEDADWQVGPARPIRTADTQNRAVGPWQIFEVKP